MTLMAERKKRKGAAAAHPRRTDRFPIYFLLYSIVTLLKWILPVSAAQVRA